MICKYMMASVPVPRSLLIPTALTSASCSPFDGGFNLRLSSSSTDPEPGRCRRTDGKKWRCSRDAAPNHKYCERHMHRGRPRSRKPVEVQTGGGGGATTTDNKSLLIILDSGDGAKNDRDWTGDWTSDGAEEKA